MVFSQADKNGIAVLKKCIRFLPNVRRTIAYALVMTAINFLILGGILYGEYYYYGITIFDAQSLSALLELEVWHHFFKIILFLAIFTFNYIISLLFLFAITFSVSKHLQKKPHGFFAALRSGYQNIGTLMHLSVILVLARFNELLMFILIHEKIRSTIDYLQGHQTEEPVAFHRLEGILFMPLLVDKKISVPEGIKESERLMHESFGEPIHPNISFGMLKLIIFIAIASTFGFCIHYHFNLLPAFVFSLILILCTYNLIETVTILFKVAVYHYTKEVPTGPFTRDEIPLYFTK